MKLRRLIGCQGTAQLVTALTVMRQRAAEQSRSGDGYADTLVVYDLAVSEAQLPDFQEALAALARMASDWEAIHFLAPPEIQAWHHQALTQGRRAMRREVRARLGGEFDEILLARNWQQGNEVLTHAYPAARRIGYGDAIGVYFSRAYLDPRGSARRSPAPANPLDRLRAVLDGGRRLDPLPFHHGYLAVDGLFGERAPFPVSTIERGRFRETIRVLAPAVPDALRAGFDPALPTAVCLTSNFSEAGVTSLDDEVAAYADFLRGHIDPACRIILKPHPRDDRGKHGRLAAALSALFGEVLVWDAPALFHLPFELILFSCFARESFDLPPSFQLAAFSSACLGPAYLFDFRCEIGFGEGLVRRAFHERFQTHRLAHEADLIAAVDRLCDEPLPARS